MDDSVSDCDGFDRGNRRAEGRLGRVNQGREREQTGTGEGGLGCAAGAIGCAGRVSGNLAQLPARRCSLGAF
ncbi:hypothetical protein Aab01nite_18880 [Paractinoplanes abujensis]|nr:hypothetical protein Aab01nite_18880 [Actinoplanes abujensis]